MPKSGTKTVTHNRSAKTENYEGEKKGKWATGKKV
jgi:hypothetical protein